MRRNLSTGMQGADVAAWQSFLNQQGFNVGTADGAFGPNTKQGTIAFQTKQGLTADGVVGPATYAAAGTLGFTPEDPAPTGATSGQDAVIDTIAGVTVFGIGNLAVYYTAGMQIDADGSPHAYKAGNQGLDYDQNAKDGNNWVGVLTDSNGNPIAQGPGDPAPGFYITTTSLQDPTRRSRDPLRYVDAEQIPFIVLPGGRLGGATLGDYAFVLNTANGKSTAAIVGDTGPRRKIGEASMAAAGALGIPVSPRDGGTDTKKVRYIVFPGSGDGRFPSTADAAATTASLAAIQAATAAAFAKLTPDQQARLKA